MNPGSCDSESDDPIAEFKRRQRETWALGNFGEAAIFTAMTAGHLVRFAGVGTGERVLDVATGTGVVAITAARAGAAVSAIDLTPELLDQARASAATAGLTGIDWREGDAESLPWPEASFDRVLSQFGHMFAPRPDVAVGEMLRVLRPGEVIAFATWPPDTFVGRAFALSARYVTPPKDVPSPILWGDESTVRTRLGGAVRDLRFERGTMLVPALSPEHFIAWQTARIGPSIRTMRALEKESARRDAYLTESRALIAEYLVDNVVRHEYLLTRALKS